MTTVISQVPDTVDIVMWAGDTLRLRVFVRDHHSLVVQDLTGYEFCATIVHATTREAVASFRVEVINDALLGDHALLTLEPRDTTALPSLGDGERFDGLWDLQVVFPSGDVRTAASGKVTVYRDISKCGPQGTRVLVG